MKVRTILAINPSARELGVAIFRDAELVYYGNKTLRNPPGSSTSTAPRRAAAVLAELVARFRPDVIVLTKRARMASTPGSKVVASLKQSAKRMHLLLYECERSLVRQRLVGTERASNRDVTARLIARYPMLSRYLREPANKWEEIYYQRVASAIAAGATCALCRDMDVAMN